jgi:ankyrin repeat protein
MLKKISPVILLLLSILIFQPACKQRNLEQKNKDLFEAVRSGNTTEIVRLLKSGANVNTKDNHGFTALHIASGRGDLATIELLINKGANVSAQNDGGDTPLHDACMNGKIEAVKLLIEKGADINAKNKSGQNPIYPTAESGNFALVKLLVSKGSQIPTTGYTPLHSAVEGLPLSQQFEAQRKEMVEYFLSQGVDVNTKGNSQYGTDATILHSAAVRADKEIIELLIKKGAQVETKIKGGKTPLFNSAMGGNIGAAEVLLANGANVNARDDSNDTALHLAIRVNNMIHYTTTKSGFEVERLLVELLLANGADVNARNNRQYTPLFEAIDMGLSYKLSRMTPDLKNQYKAILQTLLENGADANIREKSGKNLLLERAKEEPEITELLIKYGAKQ